MLLILSIFLSNIAMRNVGLGEIDYLYYQYLCFDCGTLNNMRGIT